MILNHPTTGEPLPPVISVKVVAAILGEHEHTVMERCRRGEIPTLDRSGQGGPWRIITAKLFRQLGLLEDVGVTPDP